MTQKETDKRNCPKCNTRMEEIIEVREEESLWQCSFCKTIDVVYGG